MEWNDVKDKQPEVDGFYFVANAEVGITPLMAVYSSKRNIFCLQDARLNDVRIMFPVQITHWALMPEGPK